MNEYMNYIDYLENNKIQYNLKRGDSYVLVSSEEGVKKFNWDNEKETT